jgi:hypothetical protein
MLEILVIVCREGFEGLRRLGDEELKGLLVHLCVVRLGPAKHGLEYRLH